MMQPGQKLQRCQEEIRLCVRHASNEAGQPLAVSESPKARGDSFNMCHEEAPATIVVNSRSVKSCDAVPFASMSVWLR